MFSNLFSFLKPKLKAPKPGKIKPVVLLILDGYGNAPASEGNAISRAKRPNITSYYNTYPTGQIIASGESVGLPANEVGNTEVGHLTMGAGRVIDQDLVRINKSIKDTSFFDNKAFLDAINHIQAHRGAKLHIAGLVGSGNVHSSLSHFWALLDFCKRNRVSDVYFHLFMDGRDSPPQEGITIIEKIQAQIAANGFGKIATVAGRYYAMDRDGRWDRTKLAYDAMVLGRGVANNDPVDAIKRSYDIGKTDEFIEPIVVLNSQGQPVAKIDDNDAFILFNFRIDRPRQITMPFVLPNFENLREFEFGEDPEHEGKKSEVVKFVSGTFKREKVVKDLFFVTMTEYQENLPVSEIAFPKIVVKETLSELIAARGLLQMHMTESEKERFVTYYFDGQHETHFPGENVVIVPSPKVATYDKKPEMSIDELIGKFKEAVNEDRYSFFVMNIPNADMVSHSGNIDATIKAVEHVDRGVGEIVSWVRGVGGVVVITADHGHAEELLTYPTTSFFITTEKGKVSTDHSNNPVPVIVIAEALRGKVVKLPEGALADIAPTICDIMGLQKSPAMTGKSLLDDSLKKLLSTRN